jgi:hypothetical protein
VAGTSIWPRPAWAAPVPPAWSMSTGGVAAAMWSPHPAATPPDRPTSGSPAAISIPRWPRSRHRCEPGWNTDRQCGQLVRWGFRPPAPPARPLCPGGPSPELARVATAPSATATASCGSRPATSTTWSPPAPSTTTRSTTRSFKRPNAAASSTRSPA